MNEEHKNSCECCKYYLREMELQHIKSSSLISTLQLSIKQTNILLKKVKTILSSLSLGDWSSYELATNFGGGLTAMIS